MKITLIPEDKLPPSVIEEWTKMGMQQLPKVYFDSNLNFYIEVLNDVPLGEDVYTYGKESFNKGDLRIIDNEPIRTIFFNHITQFITF